MFINKKFGSHIPNSDKAICRGGGDYLKKFNIDFLDYLYILYITAYDYIRVLK